MNNGSNVEHIDHINYNSPNMLRSADDYLHQYMP